LVVQPDIEIWNFDAKSSNSMKSSNPDSGLQDITDGVAPTLTAIAPNPALNQGGMAIAQEMIVRKLTPLECERLQGFPDNWTRISWRGKPESECPDGHRYKACGNSMAVPVIRWLGERIEAVDVHVPTSPIANPLPVEKSRVISDFKDGVVVAQDTMDEWFS
jgi:hypothetical protein